MRSITRQDIDDSRSGAARVFDFFRDRLLSGELKAGDQLLPERELSLALSVSRPMLREALRALACWAFSTSSMAAAPSCGVSMPRCWGRR